MSIAEERFSSSHGRLPTVDELARNTEMYVWNEGRPVATLHPEAKIERIEKLFPYLVEPNYKILVNKPIMMYMIHMSVLSIGFILLFFGYQYMKDPPQGAYIEKIMFLFLVFCSMEILHAWSAVKALEWQTFASVMGAGQYASLGVLLLIALFFALRLRFITSANGEFYEQELATSPSGITRWRDTLDNMVIDSFFNRRALVGRLFVPAGRRGQRLIPKSK
jgi:magnesium-transporting ATPase (P-type)